MSDLVVDASVAVKWLIPEAGFTAARRLLDGGDSLRAPDLLLLEAASALFKRVRLAELAPSEAVQALDTLQALPLRVEPDAPFVPLALRLAVELRHSVYDCMYLAHALALEAVVVTADMGFVEVCRRGAYGSRVRPLG